VIVAACSSKPGEDSGDAITSSDGAGAGAGDIDGGEDLHEGTDVDEDLHEGTDVDEETTEGLDVGDAGDGTEGRGDAREDRTEGFDIPSDTSSDEFCSLTGHSFTQHDSLRCLSFPDRLVLRSSSVLVVAQNATPEQFQDCFPDFPEVTDTGWQGGGAYYRNRAEGVHFINASAAVFDIENGLPFIDGGETYQFRDGQCTGGVGFGGSGEGALWTGTKVDDTSIQVPSADFYNLSRLVPIRPGNEVRSWDVVLEGGLEAAAVATPGSFPSFGHPDMVITEVNHGETSGCSFVEIACPNRAMIVPDADQYVDMPDYDYDYDWDWRVPPMACCETHTGVCTIVTDRYDCDGPVFDQPTCDPDPCPVGPCCDDEGVCTITPPVTCVGRYLGDGNSCVPNPCPDPTGGCCVGGGVCMVTTSRLCDGEYLGDGTDCEGDPCLGACCPDGFGECIDGTTAATCAGDYQGDRTFCTDVDCPDPPPTGACCTSDGCGVVTEAACGGEYQGDATDCSDNPCPGSCCVGDECSLTDESTCAGAWYGDPVCDGCPELRACCRFDGSCAVMEAGECEPSGGHPLNSTLACEDNTCLGACCNFRDGTCADGVAGNDCVASYEDWGFYGSTCATVDCPPRDQDLDGVADDEDVCIGVYDPDHQSRDDDRDGEGDCCDASPVNCADYPLEGADHSEPAPSVAACSTQFNAWFSELGTPEPCTVLCGYGRIFGGAACVIDSETINEGYCCHYASETFICPPGEAPCECGTEEEQRDACAELNPMR
jgi:hypothetical protein